MGLHPVFALRAHLTPAAKGRQVSDMPDFLGLFSLKKSPNKTAIKDIIKEWRQHYEK